MKQVKKNKYQNSYKSVKKNRYLTIPGEIIPDSLNYDETQKENAKIYFKFLTMNIDNFNDQLEENRREILMPLVEHIKYLEGELYKATFYLDVYKTEILKKEIEKNVSLYDNYRQKHLNLIQQENAKTLLAIEQEKIKEMEKIKEIKKEKELNEMEKEEIARVLEKQGIDINTTQKNSDEILQLLVMHYDFIQDVNYEILKYMPTVIEDNINDLKYETEFYIYNLSRGKEYSKEVRDELEIELKTHKKKKKKFLKNKFNIFTNNIKSELTASEDKKKLILKYIEQLKKYTELNIDKYEKEMELYFRTDILNSMIETDIKNLKNKLKELNKEDEQYKLINDKINSLRSSKKSYEEGPKTIKIAEKIVEDDDEINDVSKELTETSKVTANNQQVQKVIAEKQVEKPVEKKEPISPAPKQGKKGEVKDNLAETLKKSGQGLHGEALPVRDIEPPQWRNFINQYGNAEIKNLFVFKQPIQRILTDIFNIISFGKLNQAKTKYGYDELVHTFFIFDTSMGVILMEKNQVLNIHLLTQEEINKLKEIPNIQIDTNRKISHQDFLRDPVFTLNVFIEKGKKYMDQDFVHYNMRTNNCQVFIRDMLIGNGLWDPRYMDFVIQNANEIFNELPQLYNDLVNGLTNSAAFFDYLIYGKALRKKDIF